MSDPILDRFLAGCRPVRDKIHAMYLFGSRAKGTARPDSDYDLLLVVSDEFSLEDKDSLYDAVMDILLETGRLVSLKIFTEQAFQRLRDMATPFMTHVLTEGLTATTHQGLVNLFGLHFVKTGKFPKHLGRFLANLKDDRESSDDEIYSGIDQETAQQAVEEAKVFLAAIEAYVCRLP